MKTLPEVIREADSFDELFKMVKKVVERSLGLRRAGLGLILADLPMNIAGFTAVGSNSIVLNRRLLASIKTVTDSKEELNSFVFIVLLHEYLHTLGYGEDTTRRLVRDIVERELGPEHLATKLAKKSPYEIYPEIMNVKPPSGSSDEVIIVKDFDTDSVTYIS